MLPREKIGEIGIGLAGEHVEAREADYLAYWLLIAALGAGVVLAILFSVF